MEPCDSETAALDAFRRRGFVSEFRLVGGALLVSGTGASLRADELTIRDFCRLEGVSDPDDMSIVYALEGPEGTRGTLVDAFGVYADPALGAFLDGVRIRTDA